MGIGLRLFGVALFWAGAAQAGDPHVVQMPPSVVSSSASETGAALPGTVTRSDDAVAERTRDGTFALTASINGQAVAMIFDTGASAVTLRSEDAARIGINVDRLTYAIKAQTANGATTLAPVTLRSLQIGTIIEYNVPAAVARPGALHTNLLGQTFLARLRTYEVQRDRVIFYGH